MVEKCSARRKKKIQTKEGYITEFTSDNDERLKMLASSCIRNLGNKGVSLKGRSSAARPLERWRHAASKFR